MIYPSWALKKGCLGHSVIVDSEPCFTGTPNSYISERLIRKYKQRNANLAPLRETPKTKMLWGMTDWGLIPVSVP